MHEFEEDRVKRMAEYKEMERQYQRSENIDDLNRQVLNLQFANLKLFQENNLARQVIAILLIRLNGGEVAPISREMTPDDLKMLKDMGIKP